MKKPNIDEYDVGADVKEEVSLSLMEIGDMIEDKIDNVPERGTKLFQAWKRDINKLIDLYNGKAGWKAYKTQR